MTQKDRCRYGTDSARYRRNGFRYFNCLVVIDITAEFAALIDIHADIYDYLSLP